MQSRSLFLDKFTMKRKAICFVEKFVDFYSSTWRAIAEDMKHQTQQCVPDSASFIEQKFLYRIQQHSILEIAVEKER